MSASITEPGPVMNLPALADKTPVLAGKLARMDPQLYLHIFGTTRKDSGT